MVFKFKVKLVKLVSKLVQKYLKTSSILIYFGSHRNYKSELPNPFLRRFEQRVPTYVNN